MALDFLAGCAGGVAGVLVGHPFDTVKVRLQVQSMERPQYRGTLHCFQSIVKQESVLGLYKGLGSPLMGLTFINALVFGVQGNTLRALGRDTPLNQFLAGAAAGAIQCVICCPMELAKTRLQLQDAGPARTYRGSLHCLAHIYRQEGLRGVNRGMASTLLRETPSFGVYFLSYDVLTRALGCEPGDRLLVPKLLLAGGTSGIVSWLSTYPVDVVKSRLQADGVRGAPRYGGFVDCVRQSYRAEGWRVFTRGLASTLLRAFPVNAATFATVTVVLTYARGPEARPEGDAVPAPSGPAWPSPPVCEAGARERPGLRTASGPGSGPHRARGLDPTRRRGAPLAAGSTCGVSSAVKWGASHPHRALPERRGGAPRRPACTEPVAVTWGVFRKPSRHSSPFLGSGADTTAGSLMIHPWAIQ